MVWMAPPRFGDAERHTGYGAGVWLAWSAPLALINAVYWIAASRDWPVGTHIMAVWFPIVALAATGLPRSSVPGDIQGSPAIRQP